MSLMTIHHLLNRTTWTIDTDTTAAMLSGTAPAWVSCPAGHLQGLRR
jgi:hypothetical protein